MKKNMLFIALLALALIGFVDSYYLASSAATDTPLICDIGGGLDGCNEVAQSPYSKVFGIPLADFGMLFYGLLFLVTVAAWRFSHRWLPTILLSLTFVGAAASVYFVTLQFFVIKAFCIYCLISAVVSWLALILAARINGALTRTSSPVVS